MKLYHITSSSNIPAIKKNGLEPRVGTLSMLAGETDKRIYTFRHLEDVEDALMGWLGDYLPEEPIALIQIDLPDDFSCKPVGLTVDGDEAGYEMCVYNHIPPKYLTVLTTDLDNYDMGLYEEYTFWKDDVFEGLEDKWLEPREWTSVEISEDTKFGFLKGELQEARYIRIPRNAAGHTMADIGETFFEHMIMLQQLRHENPEAAMKYAKDTMKFMDFSNVRSGATDLHNLASIIMNPSKFADEVGGDSGVRIPEMQFKRWLRDIKAGNMNPSMDRQFLYKLEKELGIKNSILRNMRRIAQDYSMATPNERKMISTRLMLHFRQDRRFMSDIFKPWAATTKGMVPKPDDVEKARDKGFKVPGWVKTAATVAAGYYIGSKVGELML